jgi:transposase
MTKFYNPYQRSRTSVPQLSDEKAQAILDATGKVEDIAKAHKVSKSLVYAIKRRAKYRHLKPSESKQQPSSSSTNANGL